jgi:alpha-beta hydrolase superfamily lysophospholipase
MTWWMSWPRIGHSLGGLIATRFVQRDQPDLTALVLPGPVIRGNPQVEALLTMDPLPEVPIDPSILSRDNGRLAMLTSWSV